MLSNFDLVTESLTLMAGKKQIARFHHLIQGDAHRSCFLRDASDVGGNARPALRIAFQFGAKKIEDDAPFFRLGVFIKIGNVSLPFELGALVHKKRASPPSSTMRFGPAPSGHCSASEVAPPILLERLPFPRENGDALRIVSRTARLRASDNDRCRGVVLRRKDVQLTQRTSAPRCASVSMRTPVCTVMCSEPMTRAPVSGFDCPYVSRQAISPGISGSASLISALPR